MFPTMGSVGFKDWRLRLGMKVLRFRDYRFGLAKTMNTFFWKSPENKNYGIVGSISGSLIWGNYLVLQSMVPYGCLGHLGICFCPNA